MVIGFTRGGYERNPGRGRAEKNGEAVESGEKGKEEEDEGKGEMEAEKQRREEGKGEKKKARKSR